MLYRFLLGLSFTMLLACQPQQPDLSSAVVYQQPGLQLQLSPASAPVETPIRLTISSAEAITAVSADLTGVSMYMGLIPVHFQKLSTQNASETEQWQAEFLLGACSDPAMLWQLNLTLQLADGTKIYINEQFNSSW